MLCVLALDSLDKPDEKGIASRDKGLTWLKQTRIQWRESRW